MQARDIRWHPFEGRVTVVDVSDAAARTLYVRGRPAGVLVRAADGETVLTDDGSLYDSYSGAEFERRRVLAGGR